MKKQYVIRLCQFLCLLALVAGVGLGAVSLSRKTSAIGLSKNGGTALASDSATSTSSQSDTATMSTLAKQIQNRIDQSNLEIGVSVIDTQTNKQFDAGESAAFLAASTTKVLTAAYYMHQVEQGEASLSTVIDGSTAQLLMQRMLQQSDNAAWASLNDYLGKTNLQTYASQRGLTSYDSAANTITAHDQAKLLAKLYANQLATKNHTNTILSYMQHTNNETLIPSAVPSEVTVYHKYGQLYGELHDSAIITSQGKTFVLVIFTKSNTDTITDLPDRTQLFHDITDTTVVAFL